MSTVNCKNCGAVFDAKLSSCPHCGTMNKRGAYAEFRNRISSLIDSMLGLKENVQQSVSGVILISLLRALILIAVIVGLAFAFSRTLKVNYYNDPEYDQKAYEEIEWLNEHGDMLNEAYESGDYAAVEKLYYQNQQAVRSWSHYSDYTLKYAYDKLKTEDRPLSYRFQDMMYFIFHPEYFTGYRGMTRVDEDDYTAMRNDLIAALESRGYTFPELEEIYQKCSDSYGYIDGSLLKEYWKEGGDG